MAFGVLITLAIVLVLTQEHVPPTMGLKTPTDPKHAAEQQDTFQGETLRLNRNCSFRQWYLYTKKFSFPPSGLLLFFFMKMHFVVHSFLKDLSILLFDFTI